MRITAVVVLACAATTAAARPDWRAQIIWRRAEEPRALDGAPAPAVGYETADLRVAQRLIDDGWAARATALLERVIFDSKDAREVCRARILAARVEVGYGAAADKRGALIRLAARLRSRRSDDDCRREGDALVGEIARVLDLEGTEQDPMTFVPVWEAAAAIATTEARHATALHDRALDYWKRAQSTDDAARWRAAATAAEQAIAADPTDDDMVARARDAWWNAALSRAGR